MANLNEWERVDRATDVAWRLLITIVVLTIIVLGLILTSGEDGLAHGPRKVEHGIIQTSKDGIREEESGEEVWEREGERDVSRSDVRFLE